MGRDHERAGIASLPNLARTGHSLIGVSDEGSVPRVSGRRVDSRRFLSGCLSEMYSESALTVLRYLNEIGISSRQGTCANCDEHRETFRSDLSS